MQVANLRKVKAMRTLPLAVITILVPLVASAQVAPEKSAATPPPATKLEAFRPKAGTIVTMGYNELGRVGTLFVDVRENRDSGGAKVRGVVVEIRESQYRVERAFVDADEIPELLKGIDAILEVKLNPTPFEMFEVRYTTKGDFQLIAFNNNTGKIGYVAKAGRVTVATAFNLDVNDIRKLRSMLESAGTLLSQP